MYNFYCFFSYFAVKMDFPANNLLDWYDTQKRDLPWRGEKNPYYIWLSEVILQQTRVEQGWDYYVNFVQAFPTVRDLATAPQDKVLRLWQGLGYYSRARNLQSAAQYIEAHCGGIFPNRYTDLLKLKGVGNYTAAAVASIAFGEAVAAVDGNVYRVLSRFFRVSTAIDSTEGKKQFQHLADKVLDKNRAGDFNQAMMELGATVCLPKKPLCTACPLMSACQGYLHKDFLNFPNKTPKKAVKNRYFHVFVLQADDKIAVTLRQNKDIWHGLYTYPLQELGLENFNAPKLDALEKHGFMLQKTEAPKPHLLTHQKLHFVFYFFAGEKIADIFDNMIWKEQKNLKNLPFPRPFLPFLGE